jgi:hypothetical protein
MAQRYRTPPSHWLVKEPSRPADPTARALWALNLDLAIFLAGLEEDERRHLEWELKQTHGF